MLKRVLEKLDHEIKKYNDGARDAGSATIAPCTIKLLGQMALIEAKVDLVLAETADVDAYVTGNSWVKSKFDSLLKLEGKFLDPLSDEVWMPKETIYDLFYDSLYLKCYIAQPDFVLLSKALKAPQKNKRIIADFILKGASRGFLELAKKYKVNLEEIVK